MFTFCFAWLSLEESLAVMCCILAAAHYMATAMPSEFEFVNFYLFNNVRSLNSARVHIILGHRWLVWSDQTTNLQVGRSTNFQVRIKLYLVHAK